MKYCKLCNKTFPDDLMFCPDCNSFLSIKNDSSNTKSEYGTCPNCGLDLVKKHGKRGVFLACPDFPECRFSMDFKPENFHINWLDIEKCPNCGSKLVKRNGPRGGFLGCSRFPQCRFSMDD